MTFQFDTSGGILCATFRADQPWTVYWSDLSPFVQGYVGAMFGGLDHPGYIDVEPGNDDAGHVPVGFSDLAPETLTRIMADCERWRSLYPNGNPGAKGGANMWLLRTEQMVERRAFPPLTVTLGDDGKIYFKGE